jgi:hypothetical protein
MRPIHGLVISVLAPILASCSAHPLVDDVTRSTTFDIVEKIRCEAKRAVVANAQRLGNDTTVAYEFTFDIKEENNASGNFTWFLPFTGGNFALAANAGSDLTRQATRNFTIEDTFGDLRKANCSAEALERNWIYPIAGDIGIYEVVTTFARLYGIENPVGTEKFSFHDDLTFVTFLGAGVQPTLTLLGNRSRVTDAGANLSAQRVDFHKVLITITGQRQTTTTIASLRSVSGGALRSAGPPRSGGSSTVRSYQALRRNIPGAAVPGAVVTHNSNLATTLLQTGDDPQVNALHELDRARQLELQTRVQNQVVGP